MADVNIRNEIKAEIAKSGWTLTDIVKEMNLLHPDETTTSQNISNKLTRGTLKYSEALEIAAIIGKRISWVPAGSEDQDVALIPPIWRNDYINALSASRRLNDMEPFSKLIAECVIETERDYCRLLKLQRKQFIRADL